MNTMRFATEVRDSLKTKKKKDLQNLKNSDPDPAEKCLWERDVVFQQLEDSRTPVKTREQEKEALDMQVKELKEDIQTLKEDTSEKEKAFSNSWRIWKKNRRFWEGQSGA